jgi:hypothetical protein
MPRPTAGTRIDYTFQGPTNGWTETWYSNNADINACMLGAQRMAPFRANLLGSFSFITQARTVQLSQTNKTETFVFGQQVWAQENIVAADVTDTPWDAILCRVSGTDGTFWYRRSMWLRGVPDSWIAFDISGNPIFQPNMYNNVAAFLKQMTLPTGFQFYMACLAKPPVNNVPIPVTNVSIGAGSPQMIVLSVANSGYSVGQWVRVSGCRGQNLKQLPPGNRGVNGLWQVVAVTSSLVTIGLPYAYLPNVPVLRVNGKIRSLQYTFVPVSRIAPLRVASRITGKIKNQLRGRKKQRPSTI